MTTRHPVPLFCIWMYALCHIWMHMEYRFSRVMHTGFCVTVSLNLSYTFNTTVTQNPAHRGTEFPWYHFSCIMQTGFCVTVSLNLSYTFNKSCTSGHWISLMGTISLSRVAHVNAHGEQLLLHHARRILCGALSCWVMVHMWVHTVFRWVMA